MATLQALAARRNNPAHSSCLKHRGGNRERARVRENVWTLLLQLNSTKALGRGCERGG